MVMRQGVIYFGLGLSLYGCGGAKSSPPQKRIVVVDSADSVSLDTFKSFRYDILDQKGLASTIDPADYTLTGLQFNLLQQSCFVSLLNFVPVEDRFQASGAVDLKSCYSLESDKVKVDQMLANVEIEARAISAGNAIDLTKVSIDQVLKSLATQSNLEIHVKAKVRMQGEYQVNDGKKWMSLRQKMEILYESPEGSACRLLTSDQGYEASPCIDIAATTMTLDGAPFGSNILLRVIPDPLKTASATDVFFPEGQIVRVVSNNWTGEISYKGAQASPTYEFREESSGQVLKGQLLNSDSNQSGLVGRGRSGVRSFKE